MLFRERGETLFRDLGWRGSINDDYGGLGPAAAETFLCAIRRGVGDMVKHSFNQPLQPKH